MTHLIVLSHYWLTYINQIDGRYKWNLYFCLNKIEGIQSPHLCATVAQKAQKMPMPKQIQVNSFSFALILVGLHSAEAVLDGEWWKTTISGCPHELRLIFVFTPDHSFQLIIFMLSGICWRCLVAAESLPFPLEKRRQQQQKNPSPYVLLEGRGENSWELGCVQLYAEATVALLGISCWNLWFSASPVASRFDAVANEA